MEIRRNIADKNLLKIQKQFFKFSSHIKKSEFYINFEVYWKNSILKQKNQENDILNLGPFADCDGYKIKDTYYLFVDNDENKIDILFFNEYAIIWNKLSDDVKRFNYNDYSNIDILLDNMKVWCKNV